MKKIALALAFLFTTAVIGQATQIYKGYKTAQNVKRTQNNAGSCSQGVPGGYGELYVKQAVTYYYENSTNQWKMCMNASGWSKMVYNLCSVSWSQATTGYYYVDNYVSGYAAYSTRDLGIGGRYSYSTSLHSTSGNGSITVCKDSWHTVDAMSSTKTYVDLGASDVNGLGVYCETASDSR